MLAHHHGMTVPVIVSAPTPAPVANAIGGDPR